MDGYGDAPLPGSPLEVEPPNPGKGTEQERTGRERAEWDMEAAETYQNPAVYRKISSLGGNNRCLFERSDA